MASELGAVLCCHAINRIIYAPVQTANFDSVSTGFLSLFKFTDTLFNRQSGTPDNLGTPDSLGTLDGKSVFAVEFWI